MMIQTDNFPPGPSGGLLGLGNTLRYKMNPIGFFTEVARTYGDISSFQLVGDYIYSKQIEKTTGTRSDQVVLLNNADLSRRVFLNEHNEFKKPDFLRESLRGNWGDAIASMEGEAWRQRRELMQPVFYHQQVSQFSETIIACTEEMLAGWQSGTTINFDEEILTLTARIAARTVLDAELQEFARPEQDVSGLISLQEALGEDFTALRGDDDGSPSVYLQRRRADLAMTDTLQIIKNRFLSGEQRQDLLSFLLTATDKKGNKLGKEEIVNEVMQLFFAGHHTIPTSLNWLFYGLSQFPEVANKVHAELKENLQDNRLTHDRLTNLPYGENVVKESMRYYPSALMIVRETACTVKIGSYVLPKGTLIYVSPYLLQKDNRNFQNPELFLPERFSKTSTNTFPKFAYLPFGAGPRVCIGNILSLLEIRLIFALIARSFRLIPAQSTDFTPHVSLTVRPRAMVYFNLEKWSNYEL